MPVAMNTQSPDGRPDRFTAIKRGLGRKCPNCGKGALYKGYLKATDACTNCGEHFADIRTDDFAPWLTIILLGHLIVPMMLEVERHLSPPMWVQVSIWIPLTAILVLALLPTAKGVCLGLMWSLRLKGDEQH